MSLKCGKGCESRVIFSMKFQTTSDVSRLNSYITQISPVAHSYDVNSSGSSSSSSSSSSVHTCCCQRNLLSDKTRFRHPLRPRSVPRSVQSPLFLLSPFRHPFSIFVKPTSIGGGAGGTEEGHRPSSDRVGAPCTLGPPTQTPVNRNKAYCFR